MRFVRLMLSFALLFTTATKSTVEADDDGTWRALAAPGTVAVMRHALAPGFSDPDNFDVKDCTTQRNLNDAGRDQARRIGAALRSRGLTFDKVYSSEWCRCQETAALLDIGPVTPLPALNSFFENRSNEPQQTAYMREFLAKNASQQKLFLVTHQVNIWALAGYGTDSGEIIVVKPNQDGEMTYLGSILIPAN